MGMVLDAPAGVSSRTRASFCSHSQRTRTSHAYAAVKQRHVLQIYTHSLHTFVLLFTHWVHTMALCSV